MNGENGPSVFEQAEALGVFVVDDDLERLLDAIQLHESKLMSLRHAVQRKLAGISEARNVR